MRWRAMPVIAIAMLSVAVSGLGWADAVSYGKFMRPMVLLRRAIADCYLDWARIPGDECRPRYTGAAAANPSALRLRSIDIIGYGNIKKCLKTNTYMF